ncbi:hypothetical protein [Paenibacillus macerans]|uniref:hypothetical protein n=1 Tax=Paenibacillus macerans TaxID=44252 RepID=UPI002041BD90|nr:hypothetical protein [Paenibacillus macerans]MCM3698229.1 hypothetical protein [Paenibacillus macerans]
MADIVGITASCRGYRYHWNSALEIYLKNTVVPSCKSLFPKNNLSVSYKRYANYDLKVKRRSLNNHGMVDMDRIFLAKKAAEDLLKSKLLKEVFAIARKLDRRDHGNQPFYSETEKRIFVDKLHLQYAPLLEVIKGSDSPTSLEGTFSYLKKFEILRLGLMQPENQKGSFKAAQLDEPVCQVFSIS